MEPQKKLLDAGSIDDQLRMHLIIWCAMFITIAIFFVMTFFVKQPEVHANRPTVLILLAGAVASVAVSFLVKARLLERAAVSHNLPDVMKAVIVGFALCEVASLLGMLSFFTFGWPYYYVFFIISALGTLAHCPRRLDIESATGKRF
jgi:hypothetical protein